MNLCTILNTHNDATSSTLVRLRQAQLLMKLPHNPKVKWFIQLENLILASPDSRSLLPKYCSSQSTIPIINFLSSPLQDGQQKEWVVIQVDNTWLIGRIINKLDDGYKEAYVIDLYRKASFDSILNTIYVRDKDKTISHFVRKHESLFTDYDHNTFDTCDLAFGDNAQLNMNRISYPTVDCFIPIPYAHMDNNMWINRWISPLGDKDSLLNIKDNLTSFNKLSFYIDGSVQNGILYHLRKPLDN
ncbi:hypothetical protein RclHR1_22610002 [Rhizophagus clarus]|uniref:Uncharacterized protein n=1 Tax=Rhizophagus clarus TaxID=94130 RepID=A0A2Z6R880_9GLOM|nr:hypothetical protein RclHR1_22610002 [Rhizophagus clarus]